MQNLPLLGSEESSAGGHLRGDGHHQGRQERAWQAHRRARQKGHF
jgi:hypothetical protein